MFFISVLVIVIMIVIVIVTTIIDENVQGILLYILPLPDNRVMKLYAIYSILCISFHNIFVEKEKYNE